MRERDKEREIEWKNERANGERIEFKSAKITLMYVMYVRTYSNESTNHKKYARACLKCITDRQTDQIILRI